jgi:ABC-type transporter Mla subunit MlaD
MASALTEMRSQLNRALRTLDAVKLQLDERRKLLKTLAHKPETDLESAWKAAEAKLKEVSESLARPEGKPRYAVGPRVSELVSELFGSIEEAYAAPTEYQQAHFKELRQQTQSAAERVEQLLGGELARLNDELGKAQLGTLSVARPAGG